ncbi:MAG: hypothetical protein FWC96_03760 [Oscillospiraceae bacterium]|nr:hypothetical protein [Oscillospiraceae bacterium]
MLKFYRYFLESDLRFVALASLLILILFASDIIKIKLGFFPSLQAKLSRRIALNSRIKGIFLLSCVLFVTIFIGIDKFVKANYYPEQINRIINNDTVSLLMQFMMLYIPIALSVIAITTIFKEKPFGVEFSSYLSILTKGYIRNFMPMFSLIVLVIISLTSIAMYQLQFRFTLVLLFALSIVFSILIFLHLHTYLFSYEKLIKKVKLSIKDYYTMFPYYNDKFNTYDFIGKLFDYGTSLKKEEHTKIMDFFDVIFNIYGQVIVKYQEHNKCEIPDIGEMDEKERTILVNNADNTLFAQGYLIDNICYLLFMLMQKDDRRHFFQLTYYIKDMHFAAKEPDDINDLPHRQTYNLTYEDHIVRKEFLESVSKLYRQKIDAKYKKNILSSWILGIEEMFLEFANHLYEKEISELLAYLRKQNEKLHADNE